MALLGFPEYRVEPGGDEMLIFTGKPEAHRFLIEWLAFHTNPENHSLGLPSWIPDLISRHSPGLIMSGFYNTLYMQGVEEIPLPKVQLRKGGAVFECPRSPRSQWIIPVPDVRRSLAHKAGESLTRLVQEIDIMGVVFDRVRTLASKRPPLPQSQGNVRINILEALEANSQYETEMVYWLSEIRMLADPTCQTPDSIMSGSRDSFDAFWRTLVYNREPQFNYQSPNQKPADWLGISFGYWYLGKKLSMKRLWQQNIFQHALFFQLLKTLADPFDKAEGRVRDGRRFFVSENGRFGWVPLRTKVSDRLLRLQGNENTSRHEATR
jgi:hypothetical protein